MDDVSLHDAVRLIRARYKQARVLLFGSHAKEADSPGSDIDLCVILENPDKRLLEISREIRKDIFPILRRPLDILVYEKNTFDERSAFPLTMESEILEYAKEL